MKKNILIGCSVLALFFLIWTGARNLNATAETETDVSSDSVESVDAGNTDEEKKVSAASNVPASDSEDEESGSESDDTENAEGEESAEATKNATAVSSSDENVLYTINTSSGSNLGMVPIVGGNAVVLMDGRYATIYQGDYTPEEQSAFQLKLEDEKALAASEGKIDAWAFYREAMLQDFDFPEGVTSIEKFAFARSSLQSVTIPDGVTDIGYGAFYHCDALSDVTIPDSVTVIEENAFTHTLWLKSWMAGGTENAPENAETTEASEASNADDFLIVGDGILLAYRGSEVNPELPAEVKSIVPGALGE